MANLYGYTDYEGPLQTTPANSNDQGGVDDDDPLRAGRWMEGDSLAPPCGTSVSTIRALLEFADVTEEDVVYDLGCGDGRICLEALVHGNARQCVGVEVEQDLVERFQCLVSALPQNYTTCSNGVRKVNVIHADLREMLSYLVLQTEGNDSQLDERFVGLPEPTVLVLYLLPEAIRQLEHDLIKLLHHLDKLRIVCNTWGLETVKPTKILEVQEHESAASTVFRLYEFNGK